MPSPLQRKDPTCAELLKVLADETRLEVVRVLRDGSRLVHELSAELEIEQSLLSHHLKVLRQAGFVEPHREGKSVRYALAADVVRAQRGASKINLGCCELRFP